MAFHRLPSFPNRDVIDRSVDIYGHLVPPRRIEFMPRLDSSTDQVSTAMFLHLRYWSTIIVMPLTPTTSPAPLMPTIDDAPAERPVHFILLNFIYLPLVFRLSRRHICLTPPRQRIDDVESS